jgi:hypothetical protein
LLDHVAHFFEDFAGKDDDGGSSVADLGVLRAGDVREDAGGGVDYVEELDRGRKRLARLRNALVYISEAVGNTPSSPSRHHS